MFSGSGFGWFGWFGNIQVFVFAVRQKPLEGLFFTLIKLEGSLFQFGHTDSFIGRTFPELTRMLYGKFPRTTSLETLTVGQERMARLSYGPGISGLRFFY